MDGQASPSSHPVSANLGDVLCHVPCELQTILFNRSARTALKLVGSDQQDRIELVQSNNKWTA